MNIWYLQITRICNHKCIFCSNPSNGNFLSLSEIEDSVKILKKEWFNSIIITWWEPTIHPNFIDVVNIIKNNWIEARVITNGYLFSKTENVKQIKDAWINIVHLSVYTYKKELNDKIREYPWAFDQMVKAIINLKKYWITTQITSVITKYNQDHLDKTVKFIKKLNPNISHFVRNVMDPEMMPKKWKDKKDEILPDLEKAGNSLVQIFKYLESIWNTFRVEKMPLCFIPWYEWANTECRKIVKDEKRYVRFLDFREKINESWRDFQHWLLDDCKNCILNEICWWVYENKKRYNYINVKPKWIDYKGNLEKIILKIKWKTKG